MNLQQKTSDARITWVLVILIAAAVMGKYLLIATRTTLWDRDEPRYARVAVEMVESGNYLVPTFNGQAWADKPILLYWLMSLPIRLLGPTELACRLFGTIGTALTCLLTYFIGRRLLDAKTGLWAMVILALSFMVLVTGAFATPDAVLFPLMVAAVAVFAHAQTVSSKMRLPHIILIGISIGLGVLAKGPIGLLPIPVIATALLLDRRPRPDTWGQFCRLGGALLIGVSIFAAWAIPANTATGGEFLRIFIGRHVIGRALKPMEHHGGNFLLYLPYYLPVIIAGFFPWTLHLPGAVSAVLGGRAGNRHCRALLIAWVVPIFIIMTLAATKLPHYILFIWPALALAVAGTIVAAQQNKLAARDKIWLRRGVWFFGPLAAAGALALIIGPWFLSIPGLRWSCLASGIVLSVMTIITVFLQRADRPQASAVVLAAGLLAFEIPFLFGVLPALEQIKISPPIAKAVNEKTTKEIPVATYKFGEPTLNFYIGRHIESLPNEQAVIAWSQLPGHGVLIISKDALENIQQRYGPLNLDKIVSKKGFNYSKGKILEVSAMIRKSKEL